METIVDIPKNILECTICFYPITSDKYVTDCSHTFHHTCIQEWSLQKPSCPLCNALITVPEFNHGDTSEEEIRATTSIEPSLVDNLEFQRYQEHVERQRHQQERERIENTRISRIVPTGSGSTIVIIGDYNEFESDDEDGVRERTIMTRRDYIKMRILIFAETANTIILLSFSVYMLQIALLFFSFISATLYRKKMQDMRCLSLFFKILFIVYSVSIEYTSEYNYDNEFYITCVPWVGLIMIK